MESRTDYQAFGDEIAAGTGLRTTAQGFGGGVNTRQGYGLTEKDDSTGLNHTWFRKNENCAERWTSPDPYNGSASLGNPQSFNRFSYVENEPTNYIDPSGLFRAGPNTWYGESIKGYGFLGSGLGWLHFVASRLADITFPIYWVDVMGLLLTNFDISVPVIESVTLSFGSRGGQNEQFGYGEVPFYIDPIDGTPPSGGARNEFISSCIKDRANGRVREATSKRQLELDTEMLWSMSPSGFGVIDFIKDMSPESVKRNKRVAGTVATLGIINPGKAGAGILYQSLKEGTKGYIDFQAVLKKAGQVTDDDRLVCNELADRRGL